MNKPVVFVSHIAEEAEMANALKDLIEENFLGMVKVFVSSSPDSIEPGDKWLEKVEKALDSCSIMILLSSVESVKYPWINFEAGAGWIRKIPVIPLCHSGMEPEELPIPLKLLQGIKISEESSLQAVFKIIAHVLKSNSPKVNFNDFVSSMKTLEEKYIFWNKINYELNQLHNLDVELFDKLFAKELVMVDLSEVELKELNDTISFILQKEYLRIKPAKQQIAFLSTGKMTGKYEIYGSKEYRDLFKNKNCEFYRE